MVSTFASRFQNASEKEKADALYLEQTYKCVVNFFGQGQLPHDIREQLRKHPERPPIRWLPDLMVIRPALYLANKHEWIWLVDSKTGRRDTDNWVLEKEAHAAHRLQRTALGLPIVYIWPDGRTCSYVDDLSETILQGGVYKGSGSGTPFWFVPKKLTRSLDDVFGQGVVSPTDEIDLSFVDEIEW